MLELLLKNGADIKARNLYGTALHAATENGHAKAVELLLEKGADINIEDGDGRTALRRAYYRKHEVRAKLGRKSDYTKGLEAVIQLLRKARDNAEGRRG
jgi:ankyrin repeat protein